MRPSPRPDIAHKPHTRAQVRLPHSSTHTGLAKRMPEVPALQQANHATGAAMRAAQPSFPSEATTWNTVSRNHCCHVVLWGTGFS